MIWLDRFWFRRTLLHLLLFPLSLATQAGVALRRSLYRARILPAAKLPVPVIVVGNISVGGTGKTPLVLWLAAFLSGHGMHPGIVSRGYGGRGGRRPQRAIAASDPALFGDEAVMLAQRCDAPLWVGADRVAAARALLEAHPDCDVILSDDGLQHYRLARDFEIAVIDGKRGFGNALMLPVGPLREPPARLASVDAIVINVTDSTAITVSTGRPPSFAMSLVGREFHNLLDPQRRAAADEFRNRRVHAVAGIGDPARFFNHLRRLGLDFTEHPFRDHHPFSAADVCFDDAECVVMTAKDAVKCRQFAKEYHWVLPVTAEVDPDFGELVLRKLRK